MNRIRVAGWSSPVARRAHNPKVVSSNLAPASQENPVNIRFTGFLFCLGNSRSGGWVSD